MPRPYEFVVLQSADITSVDCYGIIDAVECWSHREATDLPRITAYHVAAVPDDLVTDLACTAFVSCQILIFE